MNDTECTLFLLVYTSTNKFMHREHPVWSINHWPDENIYINSSSDRPAIAICSICNSKSSISTSSVITYVSDAWPGKTSDRLITERSGLLGALEPGDSVMADTGCTIGDSLQKEKWHLNIPPFRGLRF